MFSSWRTWCYIAPLGLLALGTPAVAQRADENAFNAAEDAFGTRVGSEGVGLYDSRNARGFDPTQAGNIRYEGLYFDQQAVFGSRLNRSQTMHVGISAQSYPFPAPTGISDTALVMPADRTIISVSSQFQDVGGVNQNALEISTPITDTLGFTGGGTYSPIRAEYAAPNHVASTSGLFRWRPSDKLEVIPLYYYSFTLKNLVQSQILPGGAYLPPKYRRRNFFGQDWAERISRDLSFGVIARGAPFTNWRAQMALFRSDGNRRHNFALLYRNTQPDGSAIVNALAYPRHRSVSTSGEARMSGVFTQGNHRHTVHFNLRGRDVERIFGGAGTATLGTMNIGVETPVAEPTFTFTPRDRDKVRHLLPGVSYVGQWARVGEFSVGLQRSFFRRDLGREGQATITTKSEAWLYNATASITPTDKLAFYAGYTRGLEEFGAAPDNAANRGQPMPASLTEQVDAGLRYRLAKTVSLVAGVFEVKKPYFDRDPLNIYTDVGYRSHKGIETSLTGQILPGLTLVAGAVFIKARVSGSSVDRGLIGNVPPAVAPAVYNLGLQYAPASWKGIGLDTQLKHTASLYANRTNTLRTPTVTTADVGFRYNFRIRDVAATFRTQILNVTNQYAWKADAASGSLAPTPPRRYNVRLAADFYRRSFFRTARPSVFSAIASQAWRSTAPILANSSLRALVARHTNAMARAGLVDATGRTTMPFWPTVSRTTAMRGSNVTPRPSATICTMVGRLVA